MRWYDFFALTYDRSLETLYRPYRERTIESLRAEAGATVLDIACGTGQNFALVVQVLGPTGHLIGVDLSAGMLKKARKRVQQAGWTNVHLLHDDARRISPDMLGAAVGRTAPDSILCTLGLTALPDWEAVFHDSFDLLRPGGRYVIMDVHARERIFQTRVVEIMAQADLARKVWEPLQRACPDFTREDLDAPPETFGGTLFIAAGTKPDVTASA